MCDKQSLRPACAYAQSDQSLCLSLEYSMSVKLLNEHHLEFQSLTGDCSGSSVYTCQIATLLEITCHGSFLLVFSQLFSYDHFQLDCCGSSPISAFRNDFQMLQTFWWNNLQRRFDVIPYTCCVESNVQNYKFGNNLQCTQRMQMYRTRVRWSLLFSSPALKAH